MYRSSRTLGLALALSAAVLCSRGAMAQTGNKEATGGPDVIELIRGANSQERYEALARYYDEQAEKARKEAKNYKAQYECYVEQEKANEKAGVKRFVET
jgi:hypothetical protein